MMKSDVWSMNWSDAWHMHGLDKNNSMMDYTLVIGLGELLLRWSDRSSVATRWNSVTFIAGEMKNPQRNIGLSLFLGTLIVTIIYVSANLMYLSTMPMHDIAFAEKDRVGVAAANVIFGPAGTIVIALMIMVSTFGCNNGLILSGCSSVLHHGKGWIIF